MQRCTTPSAQLPAPRPRAAPTSRSRARSTPAGAPQLWCSSPIRRRRELVTPPASWREAPIDEGEDIENEKADIGRDRVRRSVLDTCSSRGSPRADHGRVGRNRLYNHCDNFIFWFREQALNGI